MKMKMNPKAKMKTAPLDFKRIMTLCTTQVRANKSKFAWLTGLFLIVLPIHLFNILFSILLITLIMKTEEDNQTDSMYCSIPVLRREVVISRFVVSLGIILAAIAAGLLVLWTATLFSATSLYPEELRITINIYYLLFPLLTLISIYFPLYSRYGHQPGIQAACYMGLGIVTTLWVLFLYLIKLISGNSVDIGSPGYSLVKLIRKAFIIVKLSAVNLGSLFFNVLIAATLVLFLLTALKLSLTFYSRREF